MNPALIHLVFNHIPVIGAPFCFLLLLAGLWRKSSELVGAGFTGLVLVAILTIPAYKTGGKAARMIHAIPGVMRQNIHEHAEAADDAFTALEVLGALSLVGLWLNARPEGSPKLLTILVLLGSLGLSVWFGWVAHLGGLIRHPEIAADFQPPQ